MSRTGLLIALGIAVIVGIPFGLWPQLDIEVSRQMMKLSGGPGPGPVSDFLRIAAKGIVTLVAAPAFIAVVLKVFFPRRPMLIPGRAALLMIATLAIGPGLLANHVLKDNWGRPRPIGIAEFGSFREPFIAWWDWRGPCSGNCSFVAGEPSAAFWTMAAAPYAPPQWRPLAYGAAIAFGAVVGVIRMAGGGHFFTDVVMGGVLMFVIVWLAYHLLYRWPRTRTTDAQVERFIAGLGAFAAPEKKRPAGRSRAGRSAKARRR